MQKVPYSFFPLVLILMLIFPHFNALAKKVQQRAAPMSIKAVKPKSSDLKKEQGEVCKMDDGKARDVHGVCKHCGCRMYLKKSDFEKTCSSCKCGKKNKECLLGKY